MSLKQSCLAQEMGQLEPGTIILGMKPHTAGSPSLQAAQGGCGSSLPGEIQTHLLQVTLPRQWVGLDDLQRCLFHPQLSWDSLIPRLQWQAGAGRNILLPTWPLQPSTASNPPLSGAQGNSCIGQKALDVLPAITASQNH